MNRTEQQINEENCVAEMIYGQFLNFSLKRTILLNDKDYDKNFIILVKFFYNFTIFL